jgi:hypothetical protein
MEMKMEKRAEEMTGAPAIKGLFIRIMRSQRRQRSLHSQLDRHEITEAGAIYKLAENVGERSGDRRR